jgi:hypothetical protein
MAVVDGSGLADMDGILLHWADAIVAAGRPRAMLRRMKIGEWDNLGPARGLLQRQLGQFGVAEYAAHVTVNPDNGRLKILVATDSGLLEYAYAPAGANPEGDWILRGQLVRWPSVRGLRLQTEAQLDANSHETRSVWRLVAEEPRIELAATSDESERAVQALLAFARACLQQTA